LARAVSGRIATTRAVCQGIGPAGPVTVVALLEPGIAMVVVAVAFPEAGLVVVEQAQSRHPFGAFPEVEVRDEQPGGAAVLNRERTAVGVPGDPRLAARKVGHGKVRGVAGVAEGQHVAGGRKRSGAMSNSVSTDTPPNVTSRFDHVVTQWMSPE
jgi:hypothetical protein